MMSAPRSTAILGISAYYHDSAAALVIDGDLVAAAQEERFTRKKHDAGYPEHAVRYCLAQSRLRPEDLAYVAFYEKPLLKFDRLLETYIAYAPLGLRSFSKAMAVWLKEKLFLRRELQQRIGPHAPLVFPEHHESHAASAFFPSPYDSAAILTVDGVGEWATAAYGIGEGHRIRLIGQLEFPHSLGLLYSAFTYYCGFRVNSGEYKLMGLAPYGKAVYTEAIYKHLIDVKPDGSLWLDMSYFNYCAGLTMTSPRFHRLFGGPPRSPESKIEQRHMDLAASIQAVTEETVIRMARNVHAGTRCRNLVLAGGVALNAVANGRLLREGPYDSIWVQPAAGDAGGALGSAFFVWHQLLENPREPAAGDAQKGSFLGPAYSHHEIECWLRQRSVPFIRFESDSELDRYVARELAAGKVAGWFQGRMEFGPRALGARSILADPRSPDMQEAINLKVKFRESFRPFAPAVLLEHAPAWFEIGAGQESPYMLFVARVQGGQPAVPAVTHVDRSARVQTVDRVRNPRFHRLLSAFYDLTGCPMLVNTSFNMRGEPMVCTPEDAYKTFLATGLDLLVLGNSVLDKKDFARALCETERQRHLARYQPD